MSIRRALVCGALLAVVAAAIGCRPKTTPTPPARADLVVLVPDPDDGRVGAASVTTPQGSVDLTAGGYAARIVAGQAPSAPTPMAADEIQRLFGDAIAARPLPPREFLLYFESGGDTLTSESQALVGSIIEFVRNRPAADVSVIGHTDTTGDPKSNAELGLRRATLIRDLLVNSGLDPAMVDIASHGEADLLVKTPDNTAEPKNRRVEVAVR